MARFVYTQEMVEFIRNGYKQYRVPELTEMFNQKFCQAKTPSQIRACIKNNKITCGRQPGYRKGEVSWLLSSDQVEFVESNYQKMPVRELLVVLNEKFNLCLRLSQLVSFVKNHKIRSGRTGRFEKGGRSWNKGKKGYMGANRTSFKKGNRPKNYRPLGSERICSKDGYVLVKVAERNPYPSSCAGWYRHKHVVLWEKHFGAVPDGFCIRFKDGDKSNISIDNLVMVSRGEHARLTIMGYGDQPDEIKPVLIGLAKLEQAVFERTNG